MKYFGGAIMYFCYHIEDDKLTSLSYLHERGAKVWYVYTPRRMRGLKQFALETWSIKTI